MDCSKTLDFFKELNRRCEFYGEPTMTAVTQEEIDVIQAWSDAHPQETKAERFFKMFPNALKNLDDESIPRSCVQSLGWSKECTLNCKKCWGRPYEEAK